MGKSEKEEAAKAKFYNNKDIYWYFEDLQLHKAAKVVIVEVTYNEDFSDVRTGAAQNDHQSLEIEAKKKEKKG